ncbi:MAG TPA: glucose 1-dehydrogenase [Candidatus Dormibacteraeota bacterium]
MEEKSLAGKVAVVTGAGSGIGYAIAELFGSAGASVVVNYFGYEQEAQQLAEKLSTAGARSIAVKADVSDSGQVAAMVAQTTETLGRLDVLVNNAGIESPAPFLDVTEESWDRMVHIDLKGAFLCAQACGRFMRDHGGGSIVNISSVHEDVPFPGFAPYAAAKGGLRMLMRNMALELAEYGIRVNNIAPGAIKTPIQVATGLDADKERQISAIVPLGRMGRPDEVAQVALFLASDRASYVTGSTYYVDGGMVRYSQAL